MSNKLTLASDFKGVFTAIVKDLDAEEVVTRRTYKTSVALTATNTSVSEYVAVTPQVNCNLRAITLAAAANVASNASNYSTITVGVRTAGGAVTNVATFTTSTTALVSFVPLTASTTTLGTALTGATTMVSGVNAVAANASVITVVGAQTGTGAPTPGTIDISFFVEET